MEQDNYILKISGTAYLPRPIENGKDYVVRVEGGVVSKNEEPNFDGTQDTTFRLKLLTAEILTEKGETIKSLDRRSNSKKLRACIWYYWDTEWRDEIPNFDEFYDQFMGKLLSNFDGIVEYLKKIK